MAKKKEEFAKQDEQLQEVNEALTGAGKWIEDNANLISWCVAGIAIVVLGIIAINQYILKPKALEASNENAKAVVYFMAGDYDKALKGDDAECIGFEAIADELNSYLHLPADEKTAAGFGLTADQRGRLLAENGSHHLGGKLFSAGDMRNGQSLVVRALADGRAAALEADEFLR